MGNYISGYYTNEQINALPISTDDNVDINNVDNASMEGSNNKSVQTDIDSQRVDELITTFKEVEIMVSEIDDGQNIVGELKTECNDWAFKYDILSDGDDLVGQQYRTDTGRIDILAIKKDASEYLIIELKKGRASDAVVGQIARYIGFIEAEVADENQEVKGAIIALDDDLRIRRALQVMPTVKFYRYEIQFRLTGE